MDQVEQVLKQYVESFKCVAQAVKCRECKWPAGEPERRRWRSSANIADLASAIRLWARYEIAQENYEGAILALQTGFGMARHLRRPRHCWSLHSRRCDRRDAAREVEAVRADGRMHRICMPPWRLCPSRSWMWRRSMRARERQPSESSAELPRELRADEADSMMRTRVRSAGSAWTATWRLCSASRRSARMRRRTPGSCRRLWPRSRRSLVPKDPMSGAAFRYTRTGRDGGARIARPGRRRAKKDELRYEITVKN